MAKKVISSTKQMISAGIHHGEHAEDNIDFAPDNSQDSHIDEAAPLGNGDEDFGFLRQQLENTAASNRDWRLESSSDDVRIYRKISAKGWSNITLKCIAELDHIPMNIVLKAISDIKVRVKWDHTLGDLEVLEQDKEHDLTFFRYNLNVPHHMQNRDAVMVRKNMKDFPEMHQHSIVQRSVDYARCPENHRTSVRADMRMNGMIIEDNTSLKGTSISWLLQVDLKGCLPSSMLNHLFAKYQADFITALIKACH